MKNECIRLRTEQHLSLREIARQTGVPFGTLQGWLKDYPLSANVKAAKLAAARQKTAETRRAIRQAKLEVEPSKYHKMIDGQLRTRQQKAKIAEAAVLFRLCLFGLNAFCSPFDGDTADWLVEIPGGRVVRVQVKWMRRLEGNPHVSLPLMKTAGHNQATRYQQGDFDFIVGYDLFTDTAYVYTWAEVTDYKRVIGADIEAAENFNKFFAGAV